MNNYISIIIPCLNEEKTIEECIKKCIISLNNIPASFEIIVVDNGSTDNSLSIAKKMDVKTVICSEKGYGNAIRAGIKNASGNVVIIGDADNTYDFMEIPQFVKSLEETSVMIIGSRYKGNIKKYAMPFLNKYLGTPFFNFVINKLFRINISDSQSGFRLITKEALDKMNLTASGMEFATELIIECAKNNIEIIEIPITLHNDVVGRKPHLRPIRDGIRIIKLIISKYFSCH